MDIENKDNSNTLVIKDDSKEVTASKGNASTQDKTKVSKKKKRNWFVQFILSIATLGVWSRLSPRNKDKKGSWGITAIIFAILFSILFADRFFRYEVNQLAKEKLQIDADILSEIIPEGENTELKVKEDYILSLESKINELKNELTIKPNLSLEEDLNLKSAMTKLQTSLASVKLENENLLGNIDALKVEKAELEKKLNVLPKINFNSLSQASDDVGCKTPYSLERSNDIFQQQYKGHWVKWNGITQEVNNDYIVISNPDVSSDLAKVYFEKKGDGYYLVKGKPITMQFILDENATCDSPFIGSTGFKLEEIK